MTTHLYVSVSVRARANPCLSSLPYLETMRRLVIAHYHDYDYDSFA